ncbi:MAG: DNA-binding transcriptional LysR family regulator [Myxococcota bacterium]|jgi:DNA-binding transcriptional LysR family regulator
MTNELAAMQTFLAVVETQSFSAAARILGVGQPSVSRRISDLEAHLGVALLARTTRQVRPTEAGTRYYEAARAAVAAVESARAVAQVEASALSGTLRVGCGTLFGDTWLAPRLPSWLERHPDLRLEVELNNAQVDLVSAGLDLSLRLGGPPSAELLGRRLKTFSRYLMASPVWVERNGLPASPAELRPARGLLFGGPGAREWVLHRGEERITVRPDHPIVASTGGFLETLALHHVGPIMVPQWIGAPRQASGELVRLLPEWEGAGLPLWAVRPRHNFQSAAARMFLEWVVGLSR